VEADDEMHDAEVEADQEGTKDCRYDGYMDGERGETTMARGNAYGGQIVRNSP